MHVPTITADYLAILALIYALMAFRVHGRATEGKH